jgi:hypothetical protein
MLAPPASGTLCGLFPGCVTGFRDPTLPAALCMGVVPMPVHPCPGRTELLFLAVVHWVRGADRAWCCVGHFMTTP